MTAVKTTTEKVAKTNPQAPPRPKAYLGVGDIIAMALAIFFRRLPAVLLLTVPSTGAVIGILYLILFEFERDILRALDLPNRIEDAVLGLLAFSLALGVGAALAAGPLGGMAAAFAQGRRTPLRACIGLMFRKLAVTLPIGVLLATAVVFLIFLNLVLPRAMTGFLTVLLSFGLSMYPLARWAPALATAALERRGFNALKRSDWLTAGYRWQGAGTLGLALVIAVIFGGVFTAGVMMGAGYVLYEVFDVRLGNALEEFLVFIDMALGLGIIIAIITLSVVVLRLRLIEIKEPPDLEEMIDVFE